MNTFTQLPEITPLPSFKDFLKICEPNETSTDKEKIDISENIYKQNEIALDSNIIAPQINKISNAIPLEKDKIEMLVFGRISRTSDFYQYFSKKTIDKIWKNVKCVLVIDKTLLSESSDQIKISLSDKFFENNSKNKKIRYSNAYLNLLLDPKNSGQDISENDCEKQLLINFADLKDDFTTPFWKKFLHDYRFPLSSHLPLFLPSGSNNINYGEKYYYFEFCIDVYDTKENSIMINLDESNSISGPPRKKIKLENECVNKAKRLEGICYPSYNLLIDINEKNILENKMTLWNTKSNKKKKSSLETFQKQERIR